LIYIDTSAFLKTVWHESESAALAEFLHDRATVSSALLAVETRRSTLREDEALLPRADLLLEEVTQIELTAAVLESASRLPGPHLRTLDAIHLATALLIRDDIETVLAYDVRLREAAEAHGLATAAPGLIQTTTTPAQSRTAEAPNAAE
jgi:predicted nucleic acid-binding protein